MVALHIQIKEKRIDIRFEKKLKFIKGVFKFHRPF